MQRTLQNGKGVEVTSKPRTLIIIAAVVAVLAVLPIWMPVVAAPAKIVFGHWIYHFLGVKGSGPFYGFWSGSGSDLGELALLSGVVVAAKRVNCHDKGCWNVWSHKVDGTPFRACRKHHPVLSQHEKITAEVMAKAHKEVHRL